MYEKILIATDGSATASKAARIGSSLAQKIGASILVLHVGAPDDGARVLQAARAELGDAIETRTVEGSPADKILEVAEETGVDLVVIGNKGMTGAKRFLLGSVPNQVSHHAPCNVLIVKTT